MRGLLVASLIFLLIPSVCFGQSAESDDLLFKPSAEGFITSWLQLGPVVLPPGIEKQTARLASRDPLRIAGLKSPPRDRQMGVGLRWKARFSPAKRLKFGRTRSGTIYLAAVLKTPQALKAWLATGSDGGIEIWCNGQRLLARNVERRAAPDTDLVGLDLVPGDNLVVLKLWKASRKLWHVYARLMDEHFGPPDKINVVLPGAAKRFDDALAGTGRLVLDRVLDLTAPGFEVKLRLAFNGGRPIGEQMNASIGFVGPEAPAKAVRALDFSDGDPADLDLGAYRFEGEDSPLVVSVEIGSLVLRSHLGTRMQDIQGLARAAKDLAIASQKSGLPRTSSESAAWRVEHLTGLVENGDRDYKYLTREIRDTEAITEKLANGQDPYWERRGELQRRGYRSEIDGSLSPYVLYVPPTWREEGDNRYGLVVSLHGLNGSPMRNMQTVFGRPRFEKQQIINRERHPRRVGYSPFFVLSPSGFGNSGYRAFGEIDVLRALEQVRERYRIDPDRIYITGLSMGGIGSASLALRHPGVFAAAVPLCGYHSLFIYPSIRDKKLRPWEKFLVSFSSNKDWALNGKYLPLHVVHGLRDNPLNSQLLVDRYNRYGYKVTYLTPDLDHDVWTTTYHKRWIFSHFRKYKRKTDPRHVAFRTSRLRYRSAHWIRIDDAIDHGQWIEIDAIWEKTNEIRIKTKNIAAFAVKNVETLRGERPVVLIVDGQRFDAIADAERWSFHLNDSQWTQGQRPSCQSLCKRPGLTGPIGDAFYGPLLFVYGSGDPHETALAKRRIAELGERWNDVTVKWPSKADVDVTPEDIERYSLVVVGTPTGNRLLSKIADQLPIRVDDGAIKMGTTQFRSRTAATSFIYPNPLNPNRYVVVHAGVSKEALYYVAHPPRFVPDYLIYDASTWGSRGGRVLGEHREILAGGFFDKNWQIAASASPQ